MYCKVMSGTLFGIQGRLIDVEVDVAEGFPKLDIVGMAGSTIKEAKERVRTGMKNSGFKFPYKRITINLAPAHIRKEGVGFDLAIAAGVLCCEKQIPIESLSKTLILGELALDGQIRPVKGILPLIDVGKTNGIKRYLIPEENLQEATLISGIEIVGLRHLKELVAMLRDDSNEKQSIMERCVPYIPRDKKQSELDFSEVIGQERAKRGLEIAVSGMHHVLLKGPPGIGKSMLARRIKTILPPMSRDEIIELTKIYSAAEKLVSKSEIITERPFRDPHHSITRAGFLGGGMVVKPGEISLAHRGVLMLDEFPEFKKEVIEALREPMENGRILLSRNQEIYDFPAEFILVAAMNPCPCGYYPDSQKCHCLPHEIAKYQNRISGPILDRIDMTVVMSPVAYEYIQKPQKEEGSEQIRERVVRTLEIQKQRYAKEAFSYNSSLPSGGLRKYCVLNREAQVMLEKAYIQLNLSLRGYDRLLKLARTIADMEESDKIMPEHLAEALTYRSLS